ncbi:ABC-type Fe3+-hydroxamate transport system, periplasmic component [Thermoanaerobacter kivui]|uniref:ABC-type Fe3+-hydroxamate transport system, periplasmic component n=1 Tax=Thermoanaerobacter kivui TaxID=2325 RepID=A0A097ANV3_THEKI|nr:ABC transporter substrate-binding protein [Thermoanaerobacter kivui]AIS51514.1 ABC-type Fe3+-hydroxamate transport system, periplasmic component [Thermoanaerobacter kivui]
MRKFKGLLALLLVFVLAFSLTACSTNTATKPENTSQTATETVKSQFPLKITDFLGREVTIEKEPQRIVSLAPSITELIYALGAGNKVVGVTDFDNYPPEVKDVPKVGGFKGPNIEAITAQKPDIIFASTLSGKEQMESLEKMGIPVVMLEAKNIDQIYQSIKLIGQITGTEKKGEELIKEMQDKIKEINDKVKDLPKVSVFYLVSLDGNWTAGKGTFIDELINLAGGENVADDVNGWAQYSVEELVKKNPDVIIASSMGGKVNIEDIKKMAGYKDTNAVKNGKVFVVSNDDIISRASNRIVLGLEEIVKFLHPEAFK